MKLRNKHIFHVFIGQNCSKIFEHQNLVKLDIPLDAYG